MIGLFIFFVVFLFGIGVSETSCPEFIACQSSETQISCPSGSFYREKVKVHGCCPGCVSLKDEGTDCQTSSECQPGLTCNEAKKCKKDSAQGCEYYKRFDPIWTTYKYWKPLCQSDGKFAPKQCKGEKMSGKCFCFNENGKRIFGEEEWHKADDMTCACSRLADHLKKENSDVTIHCDRTGNFEPLQCDKKICWCASPKTGIPYTIMVPVEMMQSLPCYNRTEVGAQYYRQCDSASHMQEVTKKLLNNHGTKEIYLPSFSCNFDGSYHRVQRLGQKRRCVYIDNSPLTEAVDSASANCNCAYDRHVAKLQQREFIWECESNGDYKPKQSWTGRTFYIDTDGILYRTEGFALDEKDEPKRIESVSSFHGSAHSKSFTNSADSHSMSGRSDVDQTENHPVLINQWTHAMYILAYTSSSTTFSAYTVDDPVFSTVQEMTVLHLIIGYVFIGYPVFFLETFIGQFTQRGCLGLGQMIPLAYGLGYFMLLNTFLSALFNIYATTALLFYIFVASVNYPTPAWMKCMPEYFPKDANCMGLKDFDMCTTCEGQGAKNVGSCYNPLFNNLSADLFKDYVTYNVNYSQLNNDGPDPKLSVHLIFVLLMLFIAAVRPVRDIDGPIRIWNILTLISIITMIAGVVFTSKRLRGIVYFFHVSLDSFFDFSTWMSTLKLVSLDLRLGEAGPILFGSFVPVSVDTGGRARYICIFIFCYIMLVNVFLVLLIENLLCKLNTTPDVFANRGPTTFTFAIYPSALGILAAAPFWGTLYFLISFGLGLQTIILQVFIIETSFSQEVGKSSYYIYIRCFIILVATTIALLLFTPSGLRFAKVFFSYMGMFRVAIVCFFMWVVLAYGFQRLYDDIFFMLRKPPSMFHRLSWYVAVVITTFGFILLLVYTDDNESKMLSIGIFLMLLPMIIAFAFKFVIYLKAKDLTALLRPTDSWGPADPEERSNRKLFNPRYEVRFRRQVEKCTHQRCLLGSHVLKKTLEKELALVSNVLLEIEDNEQERKSKKDIIEALRVHRTVMSKFLAERQPAEVAIILNKQARK